MKVSRHIHLASAPAAIRTAKFEGRDRVVVPIVALVEGVIHAMGADEPELVLASEFSVAPAGWNGRPVMNDHPMDGEQPVSANVPSILEAAGYGQVFNTAVVGSKLTMEEWIDPAKVAAIGGEAQRTLDRVMAGQPTEISVGVQVVVEKVSGVWNGKPYSGIWREITPDHIANLPEGARGACSNAMGCGTLRTARITDNGFEEVTPMTEPVKRRTLRERLTDLFRAAVKGWSQTEIKQELREALKQIEPLYNYIDDVWEEDGYVVYAVYSAVPGGMLAFHPDGYPMEPYTTKIYKRQFTMTAEGVVTLADRVEVEFVGSFEPVTAAAGRAAACSCGGRVSPTTAAASQPQGEGMKTKAERITALMGHAHNPVKDQKALEALPDAVLDALEASSDAAATAKAAAEKLATDKAAADAELATLKAAAGQTAAPAPLTTEQFMAAAPAEITDIVTRFKAAEAAKKAELVAKLKAAQQVHTEAELNAMSVEQLTKVAALVKVDAGTTDYSGRFAGGAPGAGGAEPSYAPPDPYAPALAAMRPAAGAAQ